MFFAFILFPHVSTFLLDRWRKQWRREIRSACSKPWAMRMRRSFSRRFNGGVGCLLRSFLVVAICCKISCHIFTTETIWKHLWIEVCDDTLQIDFVWSCWYFMNYLIFWYFLWIGWIFHDISKLIPRTGHSFRLTLGLGRAGVASGPWGGTAAAFGSNIIAVD